MRVRLYEVGARPLGVVFIDRFPANLGLTEDGRIQPENDFAPGICRLEDVGGQLYLRARQAFELEVNDAPLEEGPLMPGDRLKCRGHDYLISYELTNQCPQPPVRFRITR